MRIERQTQQIVQFGVQVGQLELCGQYRLLALQETRLALDSRNVQSTAVADVLFTFAQPLGSVGALLFGRLRLEARDQNTEIRSVYLESDLGFLDLRKMP